MHDCCVYLPVTAHQLIQDNGNQIVDGVEFVRYFFHLANEEREAQRMVRQIVNQPYYVFLSACPPAWVSVSPCVPGAAAVPGAQEETGAAREGGDAAQVRCA